MSLSHPLPNRVHANGSLVASKTRGTLMGNRGGQFHDPATQSIRKRVPWANRQWISCVLQFKGRQRKVWTQGYTELFFLDEVTALSAGHRPCFECRREAAKAFQAALFRARAEQEGWKTLPKAAAMDALLHKARLVSEPRSAKVGDLPSGTLFMANDAVLGKTPDDIKRWTFEGYQDVADVKADEVVHLLTPAPIVAALAQGYEPEWHSTAGHSNHG